MAFRGAPETETFRNAQVIFKNFKGLPTKFNPKGGVRTFNIVLFEDEAQELQRRGWNTVKELKDRLDDEGRQLYTMKVEVSYKIRPPRCWLVTKAARNFLPEDLIGTFDEVELEKCDLTITAYDWEVSGEKGRKAYLKVFYGTMTEDPLEQEYANIPESGNPINTGHVQGESAGQNPNDFDKDLQPA